MFKNQEQVKTFVDKLEIYIENIIYVKTFASQGMDEAAKATIPILNKRRSELEEFIALACNITPAADTTDEYACPECGHDMKLRTNRSNGNKFWGCVKYPDCKGTRDENGLSKAEREEAKVIREQQSGFSFNRDKRNPVTEVSPPVETGWVNPFKK